MPTSGVDGSAGPQGYHASTGLADSTHRNEDNEEKSPTKHAVANANNEAGSNKETAQIILKGVPILKAKTCIEVTGVGKGSGKWYCKKVIQMWDMHKGYLTQAVLTRGKGGGDTPLGSGDSVNPPPGQVTQ